MEMLQGFNNAMGISIESIVFITVGVFIAFMVYAILKQ